MQYFVTNIGHYMQKLQSNKDSLKDKLKPSI